MATDGPTMPAAQARRIAIAAQRLDRPLPLDAPLPSRTAVRNAARAQAVLQIDSVNVLARAHYLPLFSRLGDYSVADLDAAAWPMTPGRGRALVESWAHEASLIPVELYPLLWWRRRDHAQGRWRHRLAQEHPGFLEAVLAVIADAGPVSAGDVEKQLLAGRGAGGWWGWSATKTACEILFAAGRTATATRRGFERQYDLTERVLPAAVRLPEPPEIDAKRALVEIAARRLGIATIADLADFFRMRNDETLLAAKVLVQHGVLEKVAVQGWRDQAYLHTAARRPRRVSGTALLCPFDPMIWFRRRTERIFDFRYRIEIYTPAEKRVHGYYVFPLLVDDQLAARFDLKADRAQGTLLVQAAWVEPSISPASVVGRAAGELRRMAQWLGLTDVVVRDRGNLPLTLAG